MVIFLHMIWNMKTIRAKQHSENGELRKNYIHYYEVIVMKNIIVLIKKIFNCKRDYKQQLNYLKENGWTVYTL